MPLTLAAATALATTSCSNTAPPHASATSKPASLSTDSTTTSTPSPPSISNRPATTSNPPEVNPAGDIPDNQVFVTYTPSSGVFSLKVPEGWARVVSAGVITFTDKLNSVRVETTDATDAPNVQSVQQHEVPGIESSGRNVRTTKVTSVVRKAGPAVLITYGADSDPDPVTGKVVRNDVQRYEFWKGGTEAILTLSGPQGADNVDPWRTVTDSFIWT
jgi:hypothetical protein